MYGQAFVPLEMTFIIFRIFTFLTNVKCKKLINIRELAKSQNLIKNKISKTTMLLLLPVVVKQALTAHLCHSAKPTLSPLHFFTSTIWNVGVTWNISAASIDTTSFLPSFTRSSLNNPRFPLPYAQFQPLRHLLQLRNNHRSRLPRRESRFSLVMHISKKEKTTFSKLAQSWC